ncbi:unnamed protein product [Lampetra planeri]
MSKFGARRKNPPTGRLKSADGMEEAPAANPESGAPEMSPGEKNWTEQEEETAAGGASALPPEAGSTVAGQLQLLLQAMAQLSATITEVATILAAMSQAAAIVGATPQVGTMGATTPLSTMAAISAAGGGGSVSGPTMPTRRSPEMSCCPGSVTSAPQTAGLSS